MIYPQKQHLRYLGIKMLVARSTYADTTKKKLKQICLLTYDMGLDYNNNADLLRTCIVVQQCFIM